MRRRLAFIVIAAAILYFITASGERHVEVLRQVTNTYSKFHSYLAQHPETLYRYRASNDSTEPNGSLPGPPLVPRIIHRIWLKGNHDTSLAHLFNTNSTCHAVHPSWTHILWTDRTAALFIAQHYPDLLHSFQHYAQPVQRSNILRYAVLHHHGGVYLDLDIECLAPLDALRHLPFLTPAAYPTGVNNAFILSRPRHAFLGFLLDRVRAADLTWGLPYVENMLSTGCMFLANAWVEYVHVVRRSAPSSARDTRSAGDVLVLADERGNTERHMLRGAVTTPLFRHRGASSWHRWDAGAIVWLGRYVVLVVPTVGVVGMGLLVWMLRRRRHGVVARRY